MQASEDEQPGSGTAIAIGALLDGVPESIVLGMSLLGGGGVGVPVLAGIFISNLPEGLSSTSGMKASGRGARYVFGVWGGIALACGVAALVGLRGLRGRVTADGRADQLDRRRRDPRDDRGHDDPGGLPGRRRSKYQLWTGFITTLGFITAFAISHSGV